MGIVDKYSHTLNGVQMPGSIMCQKKLVGGGSQGWCKCVPKKHSLECTAPGIFQIDYLVG